MDLLRIDIDQKALERMTAVSEATERQIEAARLSALRKVRAPIRDAIKKQASRDLRIPQYSIDDRFYYSDVPEGAEEMKVWIGTWAVSLFSAGQPKQNKVGVSVGRLRYPGAFISRIYSANEQVWIRLHSKHYNPELYPTRHRPGDRGLEELRGRFPVVRAAIKIDAIVARVLEREGEGFRQKFMQIFAHELNYQVNIKGKN